MLAQPVFFADGRLKRIAKIGFGVMVAVYIADCFTPLRFHYDSLRYFAIKDCIEFGCPPDSDAAKDYFPIGYTALLVILSKLGILKSFSLVLINSIYLFAGLYFTYKIFEKKISPYFYFGIVLLNWLFVKFTSHPLSEMQYIFFSLTSVYFFYRFTQRKQFKWFVLSLLMGWLAFMTRTVGVTLIAALVVGLIWEFKEQQMNFLRNNKFLVGGALAVVIAALIIFSQQLGISHYGEVLSEHFKEAPFFKRVSWRFKEWGEIFLNTSSIKIVNYISGKWGELIFIALGLVIFGWFIFKLYVRKNTIPFFIKAYLLFYCLIMFNWPFNDPRFWVPVMPLIAAVIIQMPLQESRLVKTLSSLLLIIYVSLGAFASGYMVYTSFDREVFSRTQAKGVYRNEYETYFFGKPLSDTATHVDPFVLDLLKRYDR